MTTAAPTSIVDELSPIFVGASAFKLSLADPNATPATFVTVELAVDYTETEPEEPTLPLEMLIVGPSKESFGRKVFRRAIPDSLFFTPIEGGRHTIVLREVGHNYWRGALVVVVEGDELPPE